MNTIRVLCENAQELIDGFGAGARARIDTAATEAGAYSLVTTIPLVAGQREYPYEHLAGISSSWYRTRFEDASGANANDYGAAFQVGDETAGLLCSLYDFKQRTDSADEDDELVLEIIRGVSDEIEDFVGQWLAPRPTNPASTMTLLFDVPATRVDRYQVQELGRTYGRKLILRTGRRLVGIRTLTALGAAQTSQPESGGVYVAATLADVLLRPRPTADGPALKLVLTDWPTGPVTYFYEGYNTVQVTGSFGWAAVSPRIQEIALAAALRRYIGKETAAPAIAVGPDGGVRLLADISPGMVKTLERIRIPSIG